MTASRKNRQDHQIWLVSVPTTPNFDAAYLHAHWVHANNETGFEQVDPNLRPAVGLTLESERKVFFAGIHTLTPYAQNEITY